MDQTLEMMTEMMIMAIITAPREMETTIADGQEGVTTGIIQDRETRVVRVTPLDRPHNQLGTPQGPQGLQDPQGPQGLQEVKVKVKVKEDHPHRPGGTT